MRTRLTLLTLSLVVLGWAPFHLFPIFRTDSPADSTVATLATLPISPATAAAVRSCDLDTARRDLEPTTALDTREGAAARVLLGLYAHACEDHAVATYLLAANEDPFGVLEDLRLWALGGSANSSGEVAGSEHALPRHR